MFNNVNPFGNRAISSSTSSDSNGRRQKEDPKEELKRYIDEDEPDEVLLGGQPILTEEEIARLEQLGDKTKVNTLREWEKEME